MLLRNGVELYLARRFDQWRAHLVDGLDQTPLGSKMMMYRRWIDLTCCGNDLAERHPVQAVSAEKALRRNDDGARAGRILLKTLRHRDRFQDFRRIAQPPVAANFSSVPCLRSKSAMSRYSRQR